ncbi:hypothetical protein [Dictyobacter formicarum]|uniref:Uncharacterized protein n=1 Tax=Dictyobacter formicarum TaxID=2778368 RepID=A0ABQ3VQP0_9CHLR|nr:hypothetical protein [Dictyobacter formicarum]GHO87641.1 hypothetical protein KSZ_56470 [Dictyobacter formicarum]
MNKTTKQLARQVQQALLALPEPILLETIDQWLKTLEELFEEHSMMDGYYELFGYRVRSQATGRQYASLDECFEAEPEIEDITWLPQTGEDLREILRKMQPQQIYHGVVALAGDAFRQKTGVANFGEPPADHVDGYVFMRNLTGYLDLRKEGADLSTEQFEERYHKDLKALTALNVVEEEDIFGSLPASFTDEHAVHFHITFSQNNQQQHRDLRQALQQRDCVLSSSLEENTLEGFVSYRPGHHHDLKMLAHVRRLLNRWQRSERITWAEWKEKPPKRLSQKKHKQKVRRKS